MTGSGQTRRSVEVRVTSALPLKADIHRGVGMSQKCQFRTHALQQRAFYSTSSSARRAELGKSWAQGFAPSAVDLHFETHRLVDQQFVCLRLIAKIAKKTKRDPCCLAKPSSQSKNHLRVDVQITLTWANQPSERLRP